MIDFKSVYVKAFLAIKEDKELLDLLEIEHKGVEFNEFMNKLRKHVVEASSPDDMLNDYGTRLCLHEASGGYLNKRSNIGTETSYLAVDIHITKDKNAIDRRVLLIANRLIEVLDKEHREKNGKQPINVGLDSFQYHSRVLDQKSNTTGWEKMSVVFKYSYFI